MQNKKIDNNHISLFLVKLNSNLERVKLVFCCKARTNL